MSERDFNTIFSERLRYYLNKYSITQRELAKRLGVGTTSVYNWCNGIKTPRMDKVDAMCEIFYCQRSDLMQEPSSQKSKTYKSIKIPVLGSVAAGVPISAIENVEGYEDIPEKWTEQGDFFALRIKGDSMSPKIQDGDIVIVRAQPDIESGEIGIVQVNGDDATCKIVCKYRDQLVLKSINPKYNPMTYEINEESDIPIMIIGKVVEMRRKF